MSNKTDLLWKFPPGPRVDEWMGNEKLKHTEATGFIVQFLLPKKRNNIMGNGFATVPGGMVSASLWTPMNSTTSFKPFHQG